MSVQDLLPNFFIIGAAKAGTTSLYDILNQHPEVYFPFEKEPAFFCDDEYYSKGLAWFIKTYYEHQPLRNARGDATSTYLFWGSKVVPRILSAYENRLPKFIVIFRDPVKLVHSFYWHSVREGREELAIEEALRAEPERMLKNRSFLTQRGRIQYAYSQIGFYAQQLGIYLDNFPRENFLFLLTEDLADFPQLVMTTEKFLELEHNELLQPVTSNQAALPRSRRLHNWLRGTSTFKNIFKLFIPYSVRHRLKMSAIELNLASHHYPPLDDDIARRLRSHYEDDVKRLEDLIGRDLTPWYT